MTFRSGGHSGGHWGGGAGFGNAGFGSGGFGSGGFGGHWQEHSPSQWQERHEGSTFNNQQFPNNFQTDLSQSTWNDMRRHTQERQFPQDYMSGRPPQGYERLHSAPPPDAVAFANRFLSQPMGAEATFEAHGRHYMARVEPHYHPQGFQGGPTGWHKGVTIYEAVSDRYQNQYPYPNPNPNQNWRHYPNPGYGPGYSGESSINCPPIPGYGNSYPEGYPPI
ncbi:MAG TPA: hypothetical protein V6C72_18340, partial [Chroococcales cyanobacterium]